MVVKKTAEVGTEKQPEVNLVPIKRHTLLVPLIGTAPLICNKFSEKAKQEMQDAQSGRKKAKEPKDPDALFLSAQYRLGDGRHGFPATGLKAAIVGGARFYNDKKLPMTILRRALFVDGEGAEMLVPILSDDPVCRQDTVRVGQGTADLRYRPQYDPWKMLLKVSYLPSILSFDSLVNLINAGGMGGIGEWRPDKSATGIYGTFEVDPEGEILEVRA